MVNWLEEGLWFIAKKKFNGSFVSRRIMVHWLEAGLWFTGKKKVYG
jgi:hypothetical protein